MMLLERAMIRSPLGALVEAIGRNLETFQHEGAKCFESCPWSWALPDRYMRKLGIKSGIEQSELNEQYRPNESLTVCLSPSFS